MKELKKKRLTKEHQDGPRVCCAYRQFSYMMRFKHLLVDYHNLKSSLLSPFKIN